MVRRLALYAFSALLCACSATKQTEVVISVASDLPIPQEIDEVGLAVSYADDDQEIIDLSWQLDQNQPDAITLPARFGVLAGKDPSRVVRYVVSAIRGGKPFLDRRAALPFARDRIIFLRMNLLSQCVGVTCSANETCGETGCEKIDKNPPDLPEYTPEQENNGHDARAADGFYLDGSRSDAGDGGANDAPADGAGDGARDGASDADGAAPDASDAAPGDGPGTPDLGPGPSCPFVAETNMAMTAQRLRLAVDPDGRVWVVAHSQPMPASSAQETFYTTGGFTPPRTVQLGLIAAGVDIVIDAQRHMHMFASEHHGSGTRLRHRRRDSYSATWRPDINVNYVGGLHFGGGGVAARLHPDGQTMHVLSQQAVSGGAITQTDVLMRAQVDGAYPSYRYAELASRPETTCFNCDTGAVRLDILDDNSTYPSAWSVSSSNGSWRAAISSSAQAVTAGSGVSGDPPAVYAASLEATVAYVAASGIDVATFTAGGGNTDTINGYLGQASTSALELVRAQTGAPLLLFTTRDGTTLRFWWSAMASAAPQQFAGSALSNGPGSSEHVMRAVTRDSNGQRLLYLVYARDSGKVGLRCLVAP